MAAIQSFLNKSASIFLFYSSPTFMNYTFSRKKIIFNDNLFGFILFDCGILQVLIIKKKQQTVILEC